MEKPKRRYFACDVNQSLLELALKLRQAEVRVNGKSLQTAVPPLSVSDGISSTVDRGRFQFTARRNHILETFTAPEYMNSGNEVVTTDSIANAVATNRFYDDDAASSVQEEIAALSENMHSKKLSLPNRTGPSLWPFLSSIKASADAEHVRFMEKNQRFYSNYDKSRIAYGYTEPLSESDFEIIIDNAVDAVLQTRDSHVSQQSQSSKNESCISAAVSVAPSSVNTNVAVPLFFNVPPTYETDNISTTCTQPAVVSKRYAAAVANPRRFRCELCPYSTNNRSHVRRHHISVHSDARPYRCYVCSKEFARCENAKVHMISRHPDVPYDVDRLRNNMFFKPGDSVPPKPTNVNLAPSTSTQSSNVSGPKTAFQLQQDVGSCGVSSQWSANSVDTEVNRAGTEHHQAIPSWLSLPKMEPKLDQSLSLFGHGNTGNHSLDGIPHSMFQTQANTMLNVQSLFRPVGPIKQELTDTKAAGYPLIDRQVCLYCQFMCQNTAELANHIATCHSSLTPALHAAPSANPGYVVLQTAAPIFLFPYGSDSVLPNRSQVGLGYHPILPKLPALSDECTNQNEAEASASQRSSPPNVPNAKAASVGCSSSSGISLSAPEKVQQSESPPTTPASAEGKRERKRQFKTFYCSRCPDRAPFRYEKSFEKHLQQHHIEDGPRREQKIASKVS